MTDTVLKVVQEIIPQILMFAMLPMFLLIIIPKVTKILLISTGSTGYTEEKSNFFLSDPIYEIRRHLKWGINNQNRASLERLIDRFDEISNSFHRLCNVEKREIRKQNSDYLEVACVHESDSMEKVMEMIDRGIPVTHNNVLQLLEVIINGLETKYNNFLNLSTEEIVQETKDLKLLQQKEIEDAKFVNS